MNGQYMICWLQIDNVFILYKYIQFRIMCIALFTIQLLQSSFTGNSISTIVLYIDKIWLILYIIWGVGMISSQVFGHLRSFKGWIQTEA